MSAAIASRAQAPLSAIIRQAYKGLRQSTRIVEGIEALPTTTPSQRADWGRIVRARAGVASVYFPAMGTFLSWPLISSYFLDGHMGQF
ncbi:uncharacterized protein GGS22DRAFT_162155 [Annulohypoxylon maeteangense]|uniref:uncharacterized protein n=1 Tax=Annulohypoxylon maeteangense TaxID=1927788 RepID=UPI0020084EBE|nr:uncharacterized protein GGS22DRAFT_162155 [Annulohypoxylon maeteangense]KAI0885853.1 hypothetical protein GGS22DRAFT_162155 [Annulohypoxylon maeteangense]